MATTVDPPVAAPVPSPDVRRRPAVATAPPPRRSRWRRLATLERPLLAAGLALITLHFLEHALAGPDTSVLGLAGIAAVPALAFGLQPYVTRATRFALAVPLGLFFAGTGATVYALDLFTVGPRWGDVTGIGFLAGGLLLAVAGGAALAAPGRRPRHRGPGWRLAHAAGWLAGAFVVGQFFVLATVSGVVSTHAMRLPVSDSLDAAHESVRIGDLAAWHVPSRKGAAVLVVHGSGSNRGDVSDQVEMVARRGYGVLAIDLPGHGESSGHANLLGAGAQPAIRASVDWLARRYDRIAGFGMSLGGEVLLEAAARDERLVAVISDGAERAADDRELDVGTGLERASRAVALAVGRAISGTREAPPLVELVGRIEPRPALLIAAGGRPDEIPVNRVYADAAGRTAELWTIPEAGHTGGLDERPAEYERRVAAFLDRALAAR